MKMKILAGTISLLCFSQASHAVYNSTITINGVTRTLTFNTAAEAQAAATNPTSDQAELFRNPTTGLLPDSSGVGAVVKTVNTDAPNDPPVVLIKASKYETVVQKDLGNGQVVTTTVDTSSANGTGSITKLNAIVESIVNNTPNPYPKANFTTAGFKDTTTLESVNKAVTAVTTATPVGTPEEVAVLKAEQTAIASTLTTSVTTDPTVSNFVTSTIVLNGVSHTYTFNSEAEARDAANNPLKYQNDFKNPVTGALPTDTIGMVSTSTSNGKTVTLIRTAADTMVVGELQADGTTTYSVLKGTGLNAQVNSFLGGNGQPRNLTLAKPLENTTYTQLQSDLKAAAAVPGAPTELTTAAAATNNFIVSTVVLNGVSHTYVFASEAEATAAANNPLKYQNDFINNGIKPTDTIGMVTANVQNGKTIILVRTDAHTMVVGEQSGDSFSFLQVSNATTTTNAVVPVSHSSLKAATPGLNDLVGKFLGAGGQPRQLNLGAAPSADTLSKLNTALASAKNVPGVPADLVASLNKASAAASVALAQATGTKSSPLTAAESLAISQFVNDKNQAATNPTAAVAGNPASLEGTMVDNAFNLSSPNLANGGFKNVSGASSDQAMGSSFATGLNYGYYNLAGRSANTITVPLIYGFRMDNKNQLLLTVPLTYASMGNSDQYQIGGGLAYKYNITDDWTFMPAVNYAYRNASSNGLTPTTLAGFINTTPDVDGHMVAGTLTSKYSWALNGLDAKSPKLTLTNMVGYFSSLDMNTTQCIGSRCGSFQTSGSVSNYVLKNGLSVGKSMDNFNLSTFFTDTQYFGDSLYFPQYNEFGFAIKPENSGRILDNLSVSANYMFSLAHRGPSNGNIDGFKLNLNYQY